MLSKYDTFSFNLYLSTVFLSFKYSTVFISLLGTIYFNLIIKFFIYVEVSTVQCLLYFKRLTIINILIRIKTDSFKKKKKKKCFYCV